jgi:hypothetical protein
VYEFTSQRTRATGTEACSRGRIQAQNGTHKRRETNKQNFSLPLYSVSSVHFSPSFLPLTSLTSSSMSDSSVLFVLFFNHACLFSPFPFLTQQCLLWGRWHAVAHWTASHNTSQHRYPNWSFFGLFFVLRRHYHSDHYGGLNGSWSYGNIICSRCSDGDIDSENQSTDHDC